MDRCSKCSYINTVGPSWSWSYILWQPEVWWKSFSFLSGLVITFSIVEIILLSSTKQNIQVRNITEKLLYDKIVIAFNWKPFRVTWVNLRFFYGIRVDQPLIFVYHCLSLFVPFFCHSVPFSLILRKAAPEYHFGFCKLFLHHAQTKQHNIIQTYIIQLSKVVSKR